MFGSWNIDLSNLIKKNHFWRNIMKILSKQIEFKCEHWQQHKVNSSSSGFLSSVFRKHKSITANGECVWLIASFSNCERRRKIDWISDWNDFFPHSAFASFLSNFSGTQHRKKQAENDSFDVCAQFCAINCCGHFISQNAQKNLKRTS